MEKPALSVLLPFRDAADTLSDCLDSIRNQTLADFELLAVDDHSTDASAAMVTACAREDPRIRLLRAPAHGLVAALNLGLQSASTALIARMDADDLMHPERLELQYDYLQSHREIAVLGTRVEAFSDRPILSGLSEYIRWQNGCVSPQQIADDIYLESPLAHPSVMFRRQQIIAVGGYREGMFPEDYDLWLRLHRQGAPMAKLPRVLLQWRDWPQRFTRVNPRCSRRAFDRLRAEALALDPRLNRKDRELAVWGAGRKTRRRVDMLLEHGFRPRVWVDIDPRKIGNKIDDAPVVAPDWLQREPKPLVLCYVARHGARELIERKLYGYGYRKGRDFLQVG